MDSKESIQLRRTDLDVWRGVAILAMIGDHISAMFINFYEDSADLEVFVSAAELFRLTLGRVAMPLFMVISGMILTRYGTNSKRFLQVLTAAVIVNVLLIVIPSGIKAPDILVLWLIFAPLCFLWKKYPVFFVIAAFIQIIYWPISWGGYQPGEVLIFLCVGALAQQASTTLPDLRDFNQPMGWLGRHPLSLYVGHIVFLSALSFYLAM